MEYALLLSGLVLLMIGGDSLVRGAVGLAEKFSIPPLIIGLTIVSLGTSAPELFISVKAALDGAAGIAIGNVVGSNIANIMLVLGLPAVFRCILCDEKGITKTLLAVLGITIVFMGMLAKGSITRLDGSILLGLLALFLYDQYRTASKSRSGSLAEKDYHDEVDHIPTQNWLIGVLLLGGLIALPLGAEMTVSASVEIANAWGVPDEVIGLTVLAIGTSLPELATTLMSVIRNNSSVALGNIVGSNIFNIAAIMGTTAVIQPMVVGGHIVSLDMWVMFAATLLLAGLTHFKYKIGKRIGGAMVSAYAAYIYMAFVT